MDKMLSSPISFIGEDLAETDEGDDLCLTTQNDRREKRETFLKNNGGNKMRHKIPVQHQQLHCIKEDLALKRKVAEHSEQTDKEYLTHAIKMSKNMETMACRCNGGLLSDDECNVPNASKSTAILPFLHGPTIAKSKSISPSTLVRMPFKPNEIPDVIPRSDLKQTQEQK